MVPPRVKRFHPTGTPMWNPSYGSCVSGRVQAPAPAAFVEEATPRLALEAVVAGDATRDRDAEQPMLASVNAVTANAPSVRVRVRMSAVPISREISH